MLARFQAVPGVMTDGNTRTDAGARVQAMALRVLADRFGLATRFRATEVTFEASMPIGAFSVSDASAHSPLSTPAQSVTSHAGAKVGRLVASP